MKWYKRLAQYCKKKGRYVTINGREDENIYLERFTVIPRSWTLGLLHVVLHRFWRSDDDGALHDHPWPWASLILETGYFEYTFAEDGETLVHKWKSPGSISIRSCHSMHRVKLKNENDSVWTLFIMGPRMKEWGFSTKIGEWTQWKEYISTKTKKAIRED